MPRTVAVLGTGAALVLLAAAAPWAQRPVGGSSEAAVTLVPTMHPLLPRDLSQLWLAPGKERAREASLSEFASAVKLEVESDYARALPILSKPALQQGALGDYAAYYVGLAELRLGRAAEARQTFQALLARKPLGYLAEAAAVAEAECNEALGNQAAALAVYERLVNTGTTAPEEILMRLAKAARAVGETEKASDALARVYYDFPTADLSPLAGAELEGLPNREPIAPGTNRYKLELERAERLFGSKRYAEARTGFERLRGAARDDDREIVDLRAAECDYFLKRARSARDRVRPYIDHARRQAEALFFYAVATRELRGDREYLQAVQRLVTDFPAESWTEEALYNLATYYIVQDDDEKADETFRELYEKFPIGRYAERAAWKIGWWAYKTRRHADAARVFEKAAADFRRSDYRPSWLYWAGRAHEALKESSLADARYTLVATDYLNSYYGRLAVARLDGRIPQRRLIVDAPAPNEAGGGGNPVTELRAALPANGTTVRALLDLELYDQAEDELRYAQKMWGDSSAIQATLGWIYHERGDLRAGINAMKRAYPQYMAAGGEELPADLLKVLFPIDYWSLIRRYASERNLDAFLLAALVAQESTFKADAKSAAKAYGLMQLLPSTGRRYAKALRLKGFSIRTLTTAETNVRLGTAYFADLLQRFGGVHFALAGYNAGERRVSQWILDRPGADRDEFIDDIPFPETQNYVKRVLGTAEDYRRLYGP